MTDMQILASVVATLITAIIATLKYFHEKNRTIYERRLNEVYAPLYGFLVAQETCRQMYFPDTPIEEAPILTLEKEVVNTVVDLTNGKMNQSSRVEQSGIINRKNFIRILDKANNGLARPGLLIAIKQYELMVYLEENIEEHSPKWEKATEKKVEVEYKLFMEIVEGYEDTVHKLGLKGMGQILDLTRAKL